MRRGLLIRDRDGADRARLAQQPGPLLIELGNDDFGNSLRVELHHVRFERYAFAGTDTAVSVDDQSNEHFGLLLGYELVGGLLILRMR